MEPRGILHFTIPVSDIARSERFYVDVLGLELIQTSPIGMAFLKAGDDHVILCVSKTPINPNPGDGILVHHAFRIDPDGYDAAIAELRAKGVEILFEENREAGVFQGRQAYFHDPDRNVLEINAIRHIASAAELREQSVDRPRFTHQPPGL